MENNKTVGFMVKRIRSYETEEEAVKKFCKNGVTFAGLSERWVRSVFRSRVVLPVLDLTMDVQGQGVNVLDHMGVSKDVQSAMWQRWGVTPEDIRASWVQDWKSLDKNDPQDVSSYVNLMVTFLTS